MFPAACVIEVTHCLCVVNGDMEKAAQLILHRQENGESISEKKTMQVSSSFRNLNRFAFAHRKWQAVDKVRNY